MQSIPLFNLLLAFIPVSIVIIVLYRWSLEYGNAAYALSRMLIQLLLIGYFLTFLFESESLILISIVLVVILLISSWISLNTVKKHRRQLFRSASIALAIGCGTTLALIIFAVLQVKPWYTAKFLIPLAGMIFSNALNGISLAAERFLTEIERDNYHQARAKALTTALIPTTNSLFAVGLVALPGMMTGQILSGVDPLIASRYQIMVMCMLYSAVGVSSAIFLKLIQAQFTQPTPVKL